MTLIGAQVTIEMILICLVSFNHLKFLILNGFSAMPSVQYKLSHNRSRIRNNLKLYKMLKTFSLRKLAVYRI